jgi:hypothetical protein
MMMTRSGRPEVGQTIEVPGHGRCTVQSNSDPSIVVLQTATGATLRIGERALQLALMSAKGADVRPTTAGAMHRASQRGES